MQELLLWGETRTGESGGEYHEQIKSQPDKDGGVSGRVLKVVHLAVASGGRMERVGKSDEKIYDESVSDMTFAQGLTQIAKSPYRASHNS